MASNTHGVEPTFDVQRYNRKAKKYINVQCPGLIKCDMLLALYRNRMKTWKWYKSIIFYLLDLCIANSWVLDKALIPHYEMQLVDFKIDVARCLPLILYPSLLKPSRQLTVIKKFSSHPPLPCISPLERFSWFPWPWRITASYKTRTATIYTYTVPSFANLSIMYKYAHTRCIPYWHTFT
jgi:hypothetical protein